MHKDKKKEYIYELTLWVSKRDSLINDRNKICLILYEKIWLDDREEYQIEFTYNNH